MGKGRIDKIMRIKKVKINESLLPKPTIFTTFWQRSEMARHRKRRLKKRLLMNEKRVILVKSNLMNEETRRPKEVEVLNRIGYVTTLLCWDRDPKDLTCEQQKSRDFYREIRLRLKAPWGSKVLLFLPIWWFFVFFWLMVAKWDISHVVNFDSIPPAIIAGKLKKKPVIYEILDTYEDQIALPSKVRSICIQVDKLFMRLTSSVILADEMQIEEVSGIPNSRVVTIYDSPVESLNELSINRQKNTTFIMFYAGVLNKARQLNLDKVFSAIRSINNVKLIIAGNGDQIEEIKEWSRLMPTKIEFIGKITYAEVLERSAKADILFVLRDPIVPVNKYICGSKVLEAMMCGTPTLVNKGTSTANKVREENCGLVVDANNIEEIRKAIIKLRDNPEMCRELGANGRKAYEQKYSWGIMERRLLTLYQNLTDEIGQRKKREQNNGELSRQ